MPSLTATTMHHLSADTAKFPKYHHIPQDLEPPNPIAPVPTYASGTRCYHAPPPRIGALTFS